MASRSAAVDPKWLRGPADRLAVEQGCRFDAAAGLRVIEFLERFCRQSKGEWAGKPIRVLDWQRDLLMRLYGWKRPDGTRRYRSCYVEIPKKNGKSTLVSGLAVYHLIADDEPGAEIYINAYDRAQASIIFDEAERMVRASPDLSRRLDCIKSRKLILDEASGGKIQANSADVPSKDGVNASLVLFDELHRQRTPDLWDIFEFAGEARRQPLRISITTAGVDRNSICYRQRDYSEKVNSGLIEDIGHLGVIYCAGPDDDIEDPATWHKANPSLGVTIPLEGMRAAVKKALESPEDLANFLRLRLNVWTNAVTRYLPRDKWDECGKLPMDERAMRGRALFAGLDLSQTTDLTALALLWPDGDGGYDLAVRFYCPEEGVERRSRLDRVPYDVWQRQGFLTATPGNVIDYGHIRADLKKIAEDHDLRMASADPWNARQLLIQLAEEDGLPVQEIRQVTSVLAGPTKELLRLVISGRLRHGGNPVLDWCADNAMAAYDTNGNPRLDKGKSNGRIDGLSAAVNALAGALSGDDGSSVYDTRGILRL